MARRMHRLTDFILRLLGKGWDQRALPPQDPLPCPSADIAGPQAGPRRRGAVGRAGGGPRPHEAPEDPTGPTAGSAPERPACPPPRAAGSGGTGSIDPQAPAATGIQDGDTGRAEGAGPAAPAPLRPAAPARSTGGTGIPRAQGASGPGRMLGGPETPGALDLDRVERTITGPMGYAVRRHDEEGHACLLGTWDDFPFVIEIPQGHDGWLLVSGDWQEPAPISQRNEIAASANDWNRDKFFPTVGVLDSPVGPRVRATYMMDMSAGITDTQLRLHLNTALSACTQALSAVGPLLPEI